VPSDYGLSVDSVEFGSARKGVVFLVLSVALMGYGYYDYTQQSEAIADAVEVEATITDTGVETAGTARRGGVEYSPEVRFEYEYDGESYTGTDIFPAAVSSNYDTEKAARDVLDGYEQGAAVTAYVDPSAPGAAFLKDKPSQAPLELFAIAAAGALLGGASIVSSYRNS
jgi:hypothetical protein